MTRRYKKCCPNCGRRQYFSSQHSLEVSMARNSRCRSCGTRGRVFSEEHRRKIGEGHRKNGTSMFNHLYSNYKNTSVKRRKLRFDLDKETFRKITSSNCHYCGAPPSQSYRLKKCTEFYLYNGIDRVENDQGYVPDNVVPCCAKCNQMKRDLKITDFLIHINSIYQYMNGNPQTSTST